MARARVPPHRPAIRSGSTARALSSGGCPRRRGRWAALVAWYRSSTTVYSATRKVAGAISMAGLRQQASAACRRPPSARFRW